MLSTSSFISLVALLPILQVAAAPTVMKRTTPMTGNTLTGDISLEGYENMVGGLTGKCAYPASEMSNLDYLVAVDSIYGRLDPDQCSSCLTVSAALVGGPINTVNLTVVDQRNTICREKIYGAAIAKAKPGLDISTKAFGELFNGATTGRFCESGCDAGSWNVTWAPTDPKYCSAKWSGQCGDLGAPQGKHCGGWADLAAC